MTKPPSDQDPFDDPAFADDALAQSDEVFPEDGAPDDPWTGDDMPADDYADAPMDDAGMNEEGMTEEGMADAMDPMGAEGRGEENRQERKSRQKFGRESSGNAEMPAMMAEQAWRRNLFMYALMAAGVLFAGGMAYWQYSLSSGTEAKPVSLALRGDESTVDLTAPANVADTLPVNSTLPGLVTPGATGKADAAGPQEGAKEGTADGIADVSSQWTQSTLQSTLATPNVAEAKGASGAAVDVQGNVPVADASTVSSPDASVEASGAGAPSLIPPQRVASVDALQAGAVLAAPAIAGAPVVSALPAASAEVVATAPVMAANPPQVTVTEQALPTPTVMAPPASQEALKQLEAENAQLKEQVAALEKAIADQAANAKAKEAEEARSDNAKTDAVPAAAPAAALAADSAPVAAKKTKAVSADGARKTANATKARPAAAKPTAVAKARWVLRAVTPEAAWIAPSADSSALRSVTVGDSIDGLGRVKAIQQEGDRWVVVTTGGKLR